MSNPISVVINSIDTRVKRLEEQIGSITDSILKIFVIHEDVVVTSSIKIYSRTVNSSFLLSTPTKAILGKTLIGDRRGAKVLEYSG